MPIAVPQLNESSIPFRQVAELGSTYILEMSVEQWIALQDHPRQGDTRRQAEKAHWDLAARASGSAKESMRWVIAADLNGQLFKVQGHARALRWATGRLTPPESVFVIVHRCASREDLLALSSAFDIQEAAKTLYDKVCGAYRQHHLVLSSKRLRYGMIVDALWLATRGVARTDATGPEGGDNELDIYGAVGLYQDELKLLDGLNPQPNVFLSGVVAAALLGLALRPHGIEFFRRLACNEGSKKGTKLDPVEATRVHIDAIKKSRTSWVKAEHADLCGKTLHAFFIWSDGDESVPEYWVTQLRGHVSVDAIVQQVLDQKTSAYKAT